MGQEEGRERGREGAREEEMERVLEGGLVEGWEGGWEEAKDVGVAWVEGWVVAAEEEKVEMRRKRGLHAQSQQPGLMPACLGLHDIVQCVMLAWACVSAAAALW